MPRLLNGFDHFLSILGGRFWVWLGILSFLCFYGVIHHNNLLGWPSPNVWMNVIDSDVYLRLTQVKELIQGTGFYNHDIVATNAPYGGIATPWTRPVDFILVTLYQFTPSDFSIEKRLLLAANWYPILIVTLLVYFLTRAAETGFKSFQKFALVALCLVLYLTFNSANYFMAGNADHHSLQALLWCIAVWLLLERPSPRHAAFLGMALGLWFWISPEALPFIFVIYALLGLKAVLKPSYAYFPTLTSVTVTIVTLLALCIEYPFNDILLSRAYDTVSVVYLALFSFCTAGFLTLRYALSPRERIKTRFIIAGVTASILGLLYLTLFPDFLKGPMADVDPYIFTGFLPKVSEATPLFNLSNQMILSGLYLATPALLLSLRFIKRSPLLFVLLATSLMMVLFQNKWSYYLEILSIITITKHLPLYARTLARKYKRPALFFHPFLFVAALFLVMKGALAVLPAKAHPYAYIDECHFEGFQLIQSGELVKSLGSEPLTLESNILGNSGIAFFTPYNYIAGYYHREGQAMQIKDKILDATSLNDVRSFLKDRNVKALLICPTGYPTWANDYFTDTPPKLDWVKTSTSLTFPQNTGIKTHPILLTIEP